MVQQMDEYRDEVANEKWLKPKLYNFPEWDSPVAVFDFEDLENSEAMLVLCVRKAPGEDFREQDTCYVWRGPEFDTSDFSDSTNLDENQFVSKCIEHYWGEDRSISQADVKVVWEQPGTPTDAFMHFFD